FLQWVQFMERRVEREADVPRQGLGEARERVVRRQLGPGRQCPVAQRALGVADHEAEAGALLHAEALAAGTPAERAVEREMMRIERFEAPAAALAGKMLTVALALPLGLGLAILDKGHVHHAAAEFQGRFDRVGHPAALA